METSLEVVNREFIEEVSGGYPAFTEEDELFSYEWPNNRGGITHAIYYLKIVEQADNYPAVINHKSETAGSSLKYFLFGVFYSSSFSVVVVGSTV